MSKNMTNVAIRFTADAGRWVLSMRIAFADETVEQTFTGPELAALFAEAGARVEREVASRC